VDGENSTISGAFSLGGFKSINDRSQMKKIEDWLELDKAWTLRIQREARPLPKFGLNETGA